MNDVNERPPRRSRRRDIWGCDRRERRDRGLRGRRARPRVQRRRAALPWRRPAAGASPADDDGANEWPQSPRELASVAARRADSCRHPVLVPSWRRW